VTLTLTPHKLTPTGGNILEQNFGG